MKMHLKMLFGHFVRGRDELAVCHKNFSYSALLHLIDCFCNSSITYTLVQKQSEFLVPVSNGSDHFHVYSLNSARCLMCSFAFIVEISVPIRAIYGLFMISKPVRARKLITHALKIYGSHTEAKIVRRRGRTFVFKAALEQTGNSPYGARECDVTGAFTSLLLTILHH